MKNYVYCLKINNLVKIGITKDVKKRFRNIEHGAGREMEEVFYLESCPSLEKIAHNHFKEYRKKGEWFDIDFEVAKNFLEKNKIEQVLLSEEEKEDETFYNSMLCLCLPDQNLSKFIKSAELVCSEITNNSFENILKQYKEIINFYWKQMGFDFNYTDYVNMDKDIEKFAGTLMLGR